MQKRKKKPSKFEREDKSNGNPLLHHFFFTSFTRIFLWTLRTIPYNCLLCCVSISRVMNAKKNSKFEWEDKSNGIPLLHHGFFFPFHENFHIFIQKLSLQFFIKVCSYFQNNECKEISKFEGEDKGNGIPLLRHSLFFSFTTIFLWTFKGKTMYNVCCMALESVPPTERAYHVKSVRNM